MARGHPVGKGSTGLHRCGGKLRAAAPANSAPLQDSKSADDGDRNDFYPFRAGQNGEKVAAVFTDDDGDGGGGAASGEPVAPTHDESCVVAKRAAREIVLAAAAGNRSAKLRHGGRPGKCIESAEDPNCEKHPRIGRSFATSPGVRTMPAAMVFPIAAAMPNHIPRTWSRRPRATAGEEFTWEEGSDVADNVRSREIREMQPSYRGKEKMQAGSGGRKSYQRSVISLQ